MAAPAAVLGGDGDLDSGSGEPEAARGGDRCAGAWGRKRNPHVKPTRQDATLWGSFTSSGWWDVLGGTCETWGRRRWGRTDSAISALC